MPLHEDDTTRQCTHDDDDGDGDDDGDDDDDDDDQYNGDLYE